MLPMPQKRATRTSSWHDDADVLVLSISLASRIPAKLFQVLKGRGYSQIVDVSKLSENLSSLCTPLIGIHSFTECDSVSAFTGKGKIHVSALKLAAGSKEWQETFALLGEDWSSKEELATKLEAFTCAWYGAKKSTSINEVRYNLFCAKKGNVESHQLPPCKATLQKHI